MKQRTVTVTVASCIQPVSLSVQRHQFLSLLKMLRCQGKLWH